jgi:hypothetical protein
MIGRILQGILITAFILFCLIVLIVFWAPN